MKKFFLTIILSIIIIAPLGVNAAGSCCIEKQPNSDVVLSCSPLSGASCLAPSIGIDCSLESKCAAFAQAEATDVDMCCVIPYNTRTCTLKTGTCPTAALSVRCDGEPTCQQFVGANAKSNSAGVNDKKLAPAKIIAPKLSLNIPGLSMPDFLSVKTDGEYIFVPFISVYLAAAFKFGTGMAAILAVIMIMIGGFIWIAAAGDSGKIKKAKGMITGAITGLILAVGSYTLLSTVNPDLVNLNGLKIKTITPKLTETLPADDVGSDNVDNQKCADESQLVSIKDLQNVIASADDNRLTSDTKSALAQAAQNTTTTADPGSPNKGIAGNGNFSGLKVVSAFRTQAYQQKLYSDALAKYGSADEAKKHVGTGATCNGPHLTGHAVDVHLLLGGKELSSSDMSQERIDALEAIMNKAGWTRYCPEWWHFEFGLSGGVKRAKPCDKPYGTGNSKF